MKKRSIAVAALLLLTCMLLSVLVSCAASEPQVSISAEIIGSTYDEISDTTFVRINVRCVNYTDGRDLSRYSFKLRFYSDSGRLLDTKECEKTGVRIGEGESQTVEWKDYQLSEGFVINGNVGRVSAVPVSVSFHTDTASGSSDSGSYGEEDEGFGFKTNVSTSRSVWGWILFAVGIIAAVISVILNFNGMAEDEEEFTMGATGVGIAGILLFIISGGLLGGFSSLGLYWLFIVIIGIAAVLAMIFAFILADAFEEGWAALASFSLTACGLAFGALTVLGLVWLFWVFFALGVGLLLFSMPGLGEV